MSRTSLPQSIYYSICTTVETLLVMLECSVGGFTAQLSQNFEASLEV